MKYKTAFYILTVLWLLVALYHSSWMYYCYAVIMFAFAEYYKKQEK